MSYPTLTNYIEHKNQFNKIIGRPLLNVAKLTQPECQSIVDMLDGELSPENLTCDGELRGADLQAKHRYLTKALSDAERYAADKRYVLSHSFSEFM